MTVDVVLLLTLCASLATTEFVELPGRIHTPYAPHRTGNVERSGQLSFRERLTRTYEFFRSLSAERKDEAHDARPPTDYTRHRGPPSEEYYTAHSLYKYKDFVRPDKAHHKSKGKKHKYKEDIRYFEGKHPELLHTVDRPKKKDQKYQKIPKHVKKYYEEVKKARLKQAKWLKKEKVRPVFQNEDDHRDYAVGAMYDKVTKRFVPSVAAAGVGLISTLFLPAIGRRGTPGRRRKRSAATLPGRRRRNDIAAEALTSNEDVELVSGTLEPLSWREVAVEAIQALDRVPWASWTNTLQRVFGGRRDSCAQLAWCELGKAASSLKYSGTLLDWSIYYGPTPMARRAIAIKNAMNMGSCEQYRCDSKPNTV